MSLFNTKSIGYLAMALDKDERDQMIALASKFKERKTDGDERSQKDRDALLDSLVDECETWNAHDERMAKVRAAVAKGETTIPKENWGVHEHHCCLNHGCKYGDEDCPVTMELTKQAYPCRGCDY